MIIKLLKQFEQAQATASRIPLGIMCKPMAGDKGVSNDEIEVVDFGATGIAVLTDSVRINKKMTFFFWIGIIRCKRCRTYINPFVTWADNGRRWR